MNATELPSAYLLFTGTGPILLLCSYPSVVDQRVIEKLQYKGIDKFLAYEIDHDAVRSAYARTYDAVAADLAGVEDLRVLDFNGHQIMANFSLDALGEPIKYSG